MVKALVGVVGQSFLQIALTYAYPVTDAGQYALFAQFYAATVHAFRALEMEQKRTIPTAQIENS